MQLSNEYKIKCFEYLTDCLISWHEEILPNADITTSFDKLKLIKLNFFAAAVGADNENDGLLRIFNNFYALPLGHVESTIYDNLKNLKKYIISKNSLQNTNFNDPIYYDEILEEIPKINHAVLQLREKNSNLVVLSSMELVEISHLWNSWKYTYTLARKMGRFSLQIPIKLIKSESKVFALNLE